MGLNMTDLPFLIGEPNPNFSDKNVDNQNNSSAFNYTNQAMDYDLKTWGWWMLQIGTPLIILIGIPGNILSFLVMKSRRFHNKSYHHYLCTLAVFDSLVLLGRYLQRVDSFLMVSGYDGLIQSYGDAACKIHNFAEHVCYLMSSWLVLCVTVERFIAINFPFKKDLFCRPKSAVTIIFVVFAIMSYSQVFRLIVIEKIDGQCSATKKYLHVYIAMHIYMYQLLLQFMLPAVVVLICNLSILYKIRQLRHNVEKHNNTSQYQPYSKRRMQHKTTCMLLIVSFTYVVTLLPLVLISLIIYISMKFDPNLGKYMYLQLRDLGHFLELISEINYGANFYIYVMSGAQFRYELIHLCSRPYFFVTNNSAHTEKVFHFKKPSSS